MAGVYFIVLVLWCSAVLSTVLASPALDSSVRVRAPPGRSQRDVYEAVRRGLGSAANSTANSTAGFHYNVNKTLDRSWDGAVLLNLGGSQTTSSGKGEVDVTEGVQIVCTTCYIKGLASGRLSIGHLNASRVIQQTIHGLENNFHRLTTKAENHLHTWADDTVDNIMDFDFDSDDYELPTFPFKFNVEVPAIPEAKLHFTFDDLELYMKLDTTLSLGSTYTYNLYTSETEAGVKIGNDLLFGMVFTIDLILDVDGHIDISSGFHIKLEDGLAIDIALFGDDPSGITFPKRRHSLHAVLRVGVQAGIAIQAPDLGAASNYMMNKLSFGAGIEVGVYSNVAEFTTNVSYNPHDTDCDLGIVQEYTFGLGAAAGATIEAADHTWGPVPETTKAIFYTTMASACAVRGTPTPTMLANRTTSAAPNKRMDMSMATITTSVVYTGVNCMSKMVNCPASLQNTSTSTSTTTFTTLVPSGTDEDDIPLPKTHVNTVTATATFGINAVKLPATTGPPKSYIPPPPKATNNSTTPLDIPDSVGGSDKNIIIVCLAVGLAMAVLGVLLVTILLFQQKRRTYKMIPNSEAVSMVAEPYASADYAASSHKPGRAERRFAEAQPFVGT